MLVEAQVTINGSKAAIWAAITNIENASETISISKSSGGITLTSSHDSKPQSIVARLMSIPMGILFKGVAKKALLQDLNDSKSAVEQG